MKYSPSESGHFDGQRGYGYISIEKFIDAARSVNAGQTQPGEYDKHGFPTIANTILTTTIHLATAPKSNAVYTAISAALADVKAGGSGPVPVHLRDGHYRGASALGHGKGYVYPHDVTHAVAAQQYLPDNLQGVEYYKPTQYGAERSLFERLSKIKALLFQK